MNVAQLFIKALENEGVETIFGVPGEENLHFLDALRESRIEFVLTRHEQAAAFMAATYGRLTGKAGVCLSTLGPGATNFMTAAAYAQLGAFPMMMITGQKPIKSSKQGQFQIVDIVNMMRPVTKYAKQIVEANLLPSMVREAFRLAQEERPGAVLLELPEDIAEEEVDSELTPLINISESAIPDASEKMIDSAVAMIKSAQRPLILIGAGANRKQLWESLAYLVQKTGIPFFNTQMGKGVVGGCSDYFLGTAALSEGDYLHCAIDRADLIINIGHDVVEKPPFFMHHGDNAAKVIHINFSPAIVDNVYFPQLEVVGDVATSATRIAERAGKTDNHDFKYYMKIRDQVREHTQIGRGDTSFPIKPSRLVWDVRSVMPENGIIALDNGIYKIWFARNYRSTQPNTVLLDNALATMGAGLPSAMEAKRIYPDRRVMAICGDGGFMMNSQELETAVRLKLDLVVLVLCDNAYGMIRWKQAATGLPDFGLDYGNPDFVKYAESYGAKGHLVESAESVAPLLEDCFQQGGMHLVACPVDYSDNQKVLIDELAKKVCLL